MFQLIITITDINWPVFLKLVMNIMLPRRLIHGYLLHALITSLFNGVLCTKEALLITFCVCNCWRCLVSFTTVQVVACQPVTVSCVVHLATYLSLASDPASHDIWNTVYRAIVTKTRTVELLIAPTQSRLLFSIVVVVVVVAATVV
jgi:hypothetical protein